MNFMELRKIHQELYEQRHGSPYDRGSADSWYSRPFNPHYYLGGTGHGPAIEMKQMTALEITAYTAGYEYNEKFGGKKEW